MHASPWKSSSRHRHRAATQVRGCHAGPPARPIKRDEQGTGIHRVSSLRGRNRNWHPDPDGALTLWRAREISRPSSRERPAIRTNSAIADRDDRRPGNRVLVVPSTAADRSRFRHPARPALSARIGDRPAQGRGRDATAEPWSAPGKRHPTRAPSRTRPAGRAPSARCARRGAGDLHRRAVAAGRLKLGQPDP